MSACTSALLDMEVWAHTTIIRTPPRYVLYIVYSLHAADRQVVQCVHVVCIGPYAHLCYTTAELTTREKELTAECKKTAGLESKVTKFESTLQKMTSQAQQQAAAAQDLRESASEAKTAADAAYQRVCTWHQTKRAELVIHFITADLRLKHCCFISLNAALACCR